VKDESLRFYYYISEDSQKYDTMITGLSFNGFEPSSTQPISLLWTKNIIGNPDLKFVNSKTKINHFPGSQYLGRKDLFHEVINKCLKTLRIKNKITPASWVLPRDYEEFKEH
jgi:hypothetical protein